MSIVPLAVGKRVDAREKNLNLKHRVLNMTPENKALLQRYEETAKRINDMPGRVLGLRVNFRKRDIPMQYARLMAEREVLMADLLAMEKQLFPPVENA